MLVTSPYQGMGYRKVGRCDALSLSAHRKTKTQLQSRSDRTHPLLICPGFHAQRSREPSQRRRSLSLVAFTRKFLAKPDQRAHLWWNWTELNTDAVQSKHLVPLGSFDPLAVSTHSPMDSPELDEACMRARGSLHRVVGKPSNDLGFSLAKR